MANTFPAHEFVCGGCRHVPGPPPGHTLVILAVAVLAITACGIGLTRSFGEASRPVATWDAPALAAPTNSTYCGLMGPYLAVLPEPDAAQFFARVCVEPAFISIVSEWGGLRNSYPNNGTIPVLVAVNLTPQTGGGPTWMDIDFDVSWVSGAGCGGDGTPCAHQEYWVGNESTGNLSGPYLDTYPLICLCGEEPLLEPTPWEASGVELVLGLIIAAVALATFVALRTRTRQPPSGTVDRSESPSDPPKIPLE